MRLVFQSGVLPTLTVFCGSFLLFMIQPMLGRTLLPVFGGGASVWCMCLAFFQTLLLVGYAYAHGVARRRRRGIHVAMTVAATLGALAVAARRGALLTWLGEGDGQTAAVLLGVALFAALPYVTLAAGSTLVQAWLAERPGPQVCGAVPRNVYSLYAVSNLGSLLGLLSYPFVLEPFVALSAQWYGLAAGLAFYSLLMARLAFREAASSEAAFSLEQGGRGHAAGGRPLHRTALLWLLLPGLSVFLLNAVTAYLLVDVTPMPMVWVFLLSVFLLSYAVGFSSLVERCRGRWCAGAAVALIAAAVTRGMWGAGSFFPNAVACVAVLFLVCSVLHGWLFDVRPEAADLTRYYLFIAAGGAGGGLLAGLVAPQVFSRITEYPLALCVCAAAMSWRVPGLALLARWRHGRWMFAAGCGVAWLLFAQATARHTQSRTLFRARNFYGCLAVTQTFEQVGRQGVFPVHYLWCGQTTHGVQVHSPNLRERNQATAYYGATGGGIAFLTHPKYQAGAGMKVGLVGLGAGTLACYGRPGDLYRFYEINPQVVRVATTPQLFTFLPDARMPIDLVLGDARRMLERERKAGDPRYDVLVLDAYSGDAVPYHLATREAFRLYFDRLEEDGVLAVHVSNWHIDLLPLCKAMSAELNVCAYGVVCDAKDSLNTDSIWVFMTRHPVAYRYPEKEKVMEVVWPRVRDMSVPTDEKGSLISLLRTRF